MKSKCHLIGLTVLFYFLYRELDAIATKDIEEKQHRLVSILSSL